VKKKKKKPNASFLVSEKSAAEADVEIIGRYGSIDTPLGRLKARVVGQDESELADVVVCVRATDFHRPDAIWGQCSVCGADIVFQPHAPKRPPKVCIWCIAEGRYKFKEPKAQ
jgi:ribosomal protein L37AE/L43A